MKHNRGTPRAPFDSVISDHLSVSRRWGGPSSGCAKLVDKIQKITEKAPKKKQKQGGLAFYRDTVYPLPHPPQKSLQTLENRDVPAYEKTKHYSIDHIAIRRHMLNKNPQGMYDNPPVLEKPRSPSKGKKLKASRVLRHPRRRSDTMPGSLGENWNDDPIANKNSKKPQQDKKQQQAVRLPPSPLLSPTPALPPTPLSTTNKDQNSHSCFCKQGAKNTTRFFFCLEMFLATTGHVTCQVTARSGGPV